MKVHPVKTVLAAALLATSLGAMAAPADDVYVGGSLGTTRYPNAVNGIAGHGSGLSGKLFGGYQLTPNFALEAGVADLGRIHNGATQVDGRGIYLDAVGLYPVDGKWSLLGRVGAAHVKLDSSNGDSAGNGLKLGLGAQYALTSQLALRGEWERYRPGVFGGKPNIDQFTAGVRVGF
jgi:OOP family OmpA-OmpF porin